MRANPPIAPSGITPPALFFGRRRFLAGALAAAGAAAWPETAARAAAAVDASVRPPLRYSRNQRLLVQEPPTRFEHVAGYNNFYEFGTDKADPQAHAGTLRTRPWSVTIAGEAEVTGTRTLEDILRPHALEERIYRLRCVERWSMIVPWVGFPLADLLRRFRPTSRARYVEFTTLHDPRQMPGQRRALLDWPYVEALRIDEAMHPLTLLVVGVYGRVLPNQNGAPLRLVVPWKYGFKSIKSIVKIRLAETQPRTSWNLAAPDEYGFYANVNPDVDHPRWSQAKERRIGTSLFAPLRPTQLFNGYAEQVAGLYRGMDLRKHF